jgi:hypothetical protein
MCLLKSLALGICIFSFFLTVSYIIGILPLTLPIVLVGEAAKMQLVFVKYV